MLLVVSSSEDFIVRKTRGPETSFEIDLTSQGFEYSGSQQWLWFRRMRVLKTVVKRVFGTFSNVLIENAAKELTGSIVRFSLLLWESGAITSNSLL